MNCLTIVKRIELQLRLYKYQILLSLFFLLLFSYFKKKDCNNVVLTEKVTERIFLDDSQFANSRFLVTKKSSSYDINANPSCWIRNCNGRVNALAYRECMEDPSSQDWNALGIKSMERYFNEDSNLVKGYNSRFLNEAFQYFSNSSNLSPNCFSSNMNFGIVAMKLEMWEESKNALLKASQLSDDSEDLALAYMFLGILHEIKDNLEKAYYFYELSLNTNPSINSDWFGILIEKSNSISLSTTGAGSIISKSMLNLALYQYFNPKAISKYALLIPGTQDYFIENRHIVIKNVLPRFVLSSLSLCYEELISKGALIFGDTQSSRYVAHNDRCARFLQHKLTDFVRAIIAHNAIPSYTYFGGYVAGSELKPHTDRHQCEFTISLTLDQSHPDKIWPLSLGKVPIFDRDDQFKGGPIKEYPPRDTVATALLSNGDGLLFMGRHLVHFRDGKLPEGQWLRQVFLHYVRDDFTKSLN